MKLSTNLRLALAGSALLLAGTMNAQVAATGVVSFAQGMRADGVSPVSVVRSTVVNATGFPSGSHDVNIGEGSGSVEFVSLGFGGELVLEFSTPICNGVGNDLKVWETSYGTPSHAAWPEMALVEARQNDCQPWQTLGLITQDAELDLGVLPFAKYIRVTDMTNPLLPVFFSSNQDGFDVDAVVGYAGCADPSPAAADMFSPDQVISFTAPAYRKNGSVLAIGSNRHKPAKMLYAPQMSDATTPEASVNFFSAGFASEIVLKFPYTIFDAPGADLNVYETSFGDKATRKCGSYPERAEFYGSVDGTTWFPLSAIPTFDLIGGAPNDYSNVLCRDGQLDIGAGGAINYIKLVDISPAGSFPGSADGYDLDGILGRCYSSGTSPKLTSDYSLEDEIGEGVFGVELYPNPTADIANLNVSAININDSYTVRVIDMMGRTVSSELINSSKGSFVHSLNMSSLPAGIYAVSVETNGMVEIVKVVKK
ncbi:MAG: T9SS type A sorting domain-containing protein [Bacteroidia bacterium]|nr:T9SS type A sorting domain-containing protein [Bacteroidia bacterium]